MSFCRYLRLKYFDSDEFVIRHVLRPPSVYLLFYVILSHAFITMCSFYILIWQFKSFDSTRSDQLIPIIVLESIMFAIKFIIDFVVYLPGDLGRNITSLGYSPWVLHFDKHWKDDYYSQKAFGWFDFDKSLNISLNGTLSKILNYLFNPLSISFHITSLTFSFISICDEPNSDLIQWHSLFSLLILSAINEVIKHYVYKQHKPHDELVISKHLKKTEKTKIFNLLIHSFGKNIANIIWLGFLNENQSNNSNINYNKMEIELQPLEISLSMSSCSFVYLCIFVNSKVLVLKKRKNIGAASEKWII